jgi:hypothetical protein
MLNFEKDDCFYSKLLDCNNNNNTLLKCKLTKYKDKKSINILRSFYGLLTKNNKELKIEMKINSIDEDKTEKNYTVSLSFNGNDSIIEKLMTNKSVLIQPTKCYKINLNKNQIYDVLISHFDRTFTDRYFYIQLKEYNTRLEKLNTRMQQATEQSDFKFHYFTCFNNLKMYDIYEALFSDQKWYRVQVIKIKEEHIKCFFLDYGYKENFEKSNIKDNEAPSEEIFELLSQL